MLIIIFKIESTDSAIDCRCRCCCCRIFSGTFHAMNGRNEAVNCLPVCLCSFFCINNVRTKSRLLYYFLFRLFFPIDTEFNYCVLCTVCCIHSTYVQREGGNGKITKNLINRFF